MDRMQAEANINLMSEMMNICRKKTLKRTHNTDALTDQEKREFSNCVIKFFEAPNFVMSALQGMGGAGGGFQ